MENNQPILDAPSNDGKEIRKGSFFTGVLYVVAFYGGGAALAGLSYLTVGHSYIHGPGLHHIILLITCAGGLGWMLLAGLRALTASRSPKRIGILFTHAIILVGVGLFIYTIIQDQRHSTYQHSDEITVTRKGDTAIVYHNDNIVYMKVRDSVLLNHIDSTNFPTDLSIEE